MKRESALAYNINIGDKVEGMIRHLCSRIPDKEWSGVLFYTVTGTFEEGLTVECKDICLMDVGSATYTEFDTSPDIAGYMVEHDLLDCHLGLIHSHSTFSAFFSGTDTSTLQEEGSYKNNFVSLIVNNAGQYVAAITRHVYSEVKNNTTYTYEMFGDGTVAGQEEGTEKKECIEYFMMNVNKPEVQQNAVDARIDEILENKRKAASKVKVYSGGGWYNDRTSYDFYYNSYAQEYNKGKSALEQSDKYKQMNIPWEEEEFKTISNKSEVDEKVLTTVMARLLTGSITCNATKVDVGSWIENYDKAYSRIFEDLVDYSEWLAPYLEFIMYHIPGAPTDIIDDALAAVYANEIIKRIGKPKGDFSKELIDQLKFYGTE